METTAAFRQRLDNNDPPLHIIEEKLTVLELTEGDPAMTTASNNDMRGLATDGLAQVEARITNAPAQDHLHRIHGARWVELTHDYDFVAHDFDEHELVVLGCGADFPSEVLGSC